MNINKKYEDYISFYKKCSNYKILILMPVVISIFVYISFTFVFDINFILSLFFSIFSFILFTYLFRKDFLCLKFKNQDINKEYGSGRIFDKEERTYYDFNEFIKDNNKFNKKLEEDLANLIINEELLKHLTIFGIDYNENYDLREIKSKYKKYAKKYHPDTQGNINSKNKEVFHSEMSKINESYEYLKKYKK